MNRTIRIKAVIISVVALGLAASFQRTYADENGDAINAVKDATKEANDATKDAKANKPEDKDVKDTEDKLDKASKNKDEKDNDPAATQKDKATADQDQKDAQAKADGVAKNDPNAEKYRDALKRRREARKKLKTALDKMRPVLQKQIKTLNEDTWKATRDIFREGEKALKDADATIAMLIEPKVSFGFTRTSSSASYDSTGGQPPFNGDSSNTGAQLSGGATIYALVVDPFAFGVDFMASTHPGQTFFAIPRHANGDVLLDAGSSVVIDLLLKGEVPVGPSRHFFFSAGIGPTFRELNLTLTSDQSAFRGGVPSMSEATWQTGLALESGASTLACPDCIVGHPLKVGVEGRVRFFPSQTISLRSPALGFTEAGSTGRTTDYSVLFTVSVPLAVR